MKKKRKYNYIVNNSFAGVVLRLILFALSIYHL